VQLTGSCSAPKSCNSVNKKEERATSDTGSVILGPQNGWDPMCRCKNGKTPWLIARADTAKKCGVPVDDPIPIAIPDTVIVVPATPGVVVTGVQNISDISGERVKQDWCARVC
jgi:hypothetical protein